MSFLRFLALLVCIVPLAACYGCASVATGVTAVGAADAALKAAGVSREVYCGLPADTRADFRAKNHIPHLVDCPIDHSWTPPTASPPAAT